MLVLVIRDGGICYGSYILAQGSRYVRRSHKFFMRAEGICLVHEMVSVVHLFSRPMNQEQGNTIVKD
jgi:hypothetical protein